MQVYHDQEWGVPVHDGRTLWEMLMLEGFQAGLSWRTILHKREGFRRAFAGFDPERVARFTASDVDRLMLDAGIVRARAKIEATIGGARVYLAMREGGEHFAGWAWAMAGRRTRRTRGPIPASTPESERLSKALKRKGFKFVGPTITYAWMQAAGMVDGHQQDCFRRSR